MVTTSAEDAAAKYREASLMVGRSVDGLVVIPACCGETRLGQAEFASVPIVTLDRPLSTEGTEFALRGSVMVDNALSARLVVEHLIAHGHRNILYLSLSNDLFTLRCRHKGYEHGMHAAGLSPEGHFTCATQELTLDIPKERQAEDRMPRHLQLQ